MPSDPITIEKSTLLIVEGKEDKLVFEELSKRIKLTETQILSIGGKTYLEVNLKTLMLTPGFDTVVSIGIVRDADDDPQAAFESVCHALKVSNLSVPQQHFVPKGTNPRISIFITPDGTNPGMLEDICLAAVAEDIAMPCLDNYFRCLQNAGITLRNNVLSKARIHTFLVGHQESKMG